MSYLELLKLASTEAVVVVTALVVLAIGLTTRLEGTGVTVATAQGDQNVGGSSGARTNAICSFIAALGLAIAIGTVLMLPRKATLFIRMLVITPPTSMFIIISLS